MGDYYGGGDEEPAELKKLNAEVAADQDDFDAWTRLVSAAESLEGGLNRNSSPQSISAFRDVFDRFLAKFPLLFAYWKKYADIEFSIAGTEAAEMVYERGVASISSSVDLWTHYCGFKVDTSHDETTIRELFERGAESVGLDFLAHLFWDKYIEFEKRTDSQDRVFAILGRTLHIPLHQYSRYFEHYRQLAASRPVVELGPEDVIQQLHAQLISVKEGGKDLDREMRARLDAYHLEVFHRTQAETNKRWRYEQKIDRPYFHVTELDPAQLENWSEYLDFEEAQGDYARISFLYERCLVTAAHYDDFWLRYARWMFAQEGKQEEVRSIYTRASCIYTPIARPAIRMQWALFEEQCDRPSVSSAIYEAILSVLPDDLDAIVALANLRRRQEGAEAALAVYEEYLQSPQASPNTKGALVAEMARLSWSKSGEAEHARTVFAKHVDEFPSSETFWAAYLAFEIDLPTLADAALDQYHRIRSVHELIRSRTQINPEAVKALSQRYMAYLAAHAPAPSAKEYISLDAEVNGPSSIAMLMRARNSASNGHGAPPA